MDHGWTQKDLGREARRELKGLRAEVEAIHRGERDPQRYVPNRADRRAAARKGRRK